VAPYGPHDPGTAAPRHENLYDGVPFPLLPNFGQVAEGAPAYYQGFPETSRSEERIKWRDRMESLQSVDDLAREVVTAADERGDETVFLYLSDNGYSEGSHRWPSKRCGYEECGRVPGLIRSAGDPSGLLASIADLAPTLAELAGVARAPTDGESLVPELNGRPQDPGHAVLLRNRSSAGGRFGHDLPNFWGLRTHRWKYLRHGMGAGDEGGTERPEELYDLSSDPFELENLAGDPSYEPTLQELRARLEAERAAAPQR
jgi:arylsulfatase A-like enzyme